MSLSDPPRLGRTAVVVAGMLFCGYALRLLGAPPRVAVLVILVTAVAGLAWETR